MLSVRAKTALGLLGLLVVLLLPSPSLGRKPRLRLKQLDSSRCARDGQITAWVAELELEGVMRSPSADDLRIKVDGKTLPDPPVKAVKFADTKRALRVALVIQASEAFALDFKSIKAGARALLRALPERSQISIIQYATEARRKAAFGPRKEALQALDGLTSSDLAGDVELVSAVKMGLRGLAAGPPARRLLVVVSDGLNESPKRAVFRKLGDRASKAGIPIHPIAFSPVDERGPLLNLGEIAKRSEGTLRWARRPGEIKEQFTNLGREVNEQLGLTFKVPDRCAAEHRVRVVSGKLPPSRVLVLPKMKPVPQKDGAGAKAGPTSSRGRGGKKTWIFIIAGAVLLLVSVMVIVLMARRWRRLHPAGPRNTGERPMPVRTDPGLRSTGERPMPVRTDPGLRSTGERPMPVRTDPGLRATGPGQIMPVPTGAPPPATRHEQVPFDELPTIAPGQSPPPQQPIAVVARASAALIGYAPPLQGWRVDLPPGEAFIGTAPDCHVCLDPDLGVATYHARLLLEAGRLSVEDLESRSGLYVNQQRVDQATLHNGDVVQAGRAVFQVQIG